MHRPLPSSRTSSQEPSAALPSSEGPSQTVTRTDTTPQSRQGSHTGAIAGSVIGGIIAVAALAGTLLIWRRRRLKADGTATALSHPPNLANGNDMSTTLPFIQRQAFAPSSKWDRFYASTQTDSPSSSSRLAPDYVLSSASTASGAHHHELTPESAGIADPELPSLVDRLYAMLHGPSHQEPPPQYDE